MQNKMTPLPINEVLEQLKTALNINTTLLLQAPPGAGKSTRVPLALLDEPWLEDKLIIMLEPRRVAARMVATQMAKLLGEEVGQRVGYQVKMESVHSQKTKILVVTEAILVRMLQSDQSLARVGLVIFDEFHERSIHSDLSLAFCLETQALLREDLKLLIMSATLNTQEISSLLGDTPVITSEGKSYEVEKIYLDAKCKEPDVRAMPQLLQKTILKSLKEDSGDILVFLQGVKEIQEIQRQLKTALDGSDTLVLPLYSALAKSEQDKALLPSSKRKIILATNIAQTSLTIEGVKVVVDTGLEKLSRFNHANAMNHLDSSFISKDTATQRAGRAGRLSSGKCYRLWHENKPLKKRTKPEILRSDLSSLLLDLALWGVSAFDELRWLDTPSEDAIKSTQKLLQALQMLDEKYHITSFGKDALSLGLHPRFAYMILRANDRGYAYEATLLAALFGERSALKNTLRDSDILVAFTHLYEKDMNPNYVNVYRAKEVLKQAQFFFVKLKKVTPIKKNSLAFSLQELAPLLLLAYPDRLAMQRAKNANKYKLSNAKGALLNVEDSLFNHEFLVVANLSANAKDSFINQALSISLAQIEEYFEEFIQTREQLSYNKESNKFDLKKSRHFLALRLDETPLPLTKEHDLKTLLLELVASQGLELLTWSKKANALRERVDFLKHNSTLKIQDMSDEALLACLDLWLEPYLSEIKSVKSLQSIELYPLLLGVIPWDMQEKLEELAPQSIEVPSGSKITIDYSDASKPILKVKIQELFGLQETPKLLNATIALQIHLLSPAMRPIQITYDLASFWKNSYTEVRKELRGKYKRHYWPEDPYEAVATNKTKKRM